LPRKINILLALNVNFDAERGGLERSSVNLVKYLSKDPMIQCYCAFTKFVDKIENIIEIETNITSEDDFREILHERKIDIILLPGGPWYSLMAAKAVKGTSCKIITAWHFSPGIIVGNTFQENLRSLKNEKNKLSKIKTLFKLIFFPLYKYKIEQANRKSFRKGYEVSDQFVVLSKTFINEFKQIYGLADTSKIAAINNSNSFEKTISKEDILIKEKTILIVARLDESSKRLSLAFKIWKLVEGKNPDWKLQIVGDGKDMKLYENIVKKLKLKNVIFEGRKSPEQYYIKAAIFFMTSRHEGWGLTLTEAQQMGCIPIAMDSFSSLHDIVQDQKNGFIIKDKDIKSYAAATQNLIDNSELRHTISVNAVINSNRFLPEVIGIKWVELFQEVVASK
jgi:glycosyltransferase involved in cell wall biosynthesis